MRGYGKNYEHEVHVNFVITVDRSLETKWKLIKI